MHTLYIATTENIRVRQLLPADFGYSDLRHDLADAEAENIGGGTVLYEACTPVETREAVRLLHGLGASVSVVAEAFDAAVGEVLLDEGVASYMTFGELAAFPRAVDPDPLPGQGFFAVVDDNPARIRLIAAITQRYGYRVEHLTTIDAIFEAASREPAMLLHHIPSYKIDMHALVRRSLGGRELTRVPYVAYKDGDGLNVDDVQAGLSRITRVLLEWKEVVSLLTATLARREVYRGAAALSEHILQGNTPALELMPLPQAFFTQGSAFFSSPSSKEAAHYLQGSDIVHRIDASLGKAAALRWLIKDADGNNISAAGV